jgi:hypothetical protein
MNAFFVIKIHFNEPLALTVVRCVSLNAKAMPANNHLKRVFHLP